MLLLGGEDGRSHGRQEWRVPRRAGTSLVMSVTGATWKKRKGGHAFINQCQSLAPSERSDSRMQTEANNQTASNSQKGQEGYPNCGLNTKCLRVWSARCPSRRFISKRAGWGPSLLAKHRKTGGTLEAQIGRQLKCKAGFDETGRRRTRRSLPKFGFTRAPIPAGSPPLPLSRLAVHGPPCPCSS